VASAWRSSVGRAADPTWIDGSRAAADWRDWTPCRTACGSDGSRSDPWPGNKGGRVRVPGPPEEMRGWQGPCAGRTFGLPWWATLKLGFRTARQSVTKDFPGAGWKASTWSGLPEAPETRGRRSGSCVTRPFKRSRLTPAFSTTGAASPCSCSTSARSRQGASGRRGCVRPAHQQRLALALGSLWGKRSCWSRHGPFGAYPTAASSKSTVPGLLPGTATKGSGPGSPPPPRTPPAPPWADAGPAAPRPGHPAQQDREDAVPLLNRGRYSERGEEELQKGPERV